ncbi:MAG: 50S ribosomal protein L16 [Planctomycetaceae bacterium]
MALMPKRVKHRKSQRRRIKGDAHRGNTVVFGEWGLQSMDSGHITAQTIEACRIAANQYVRGMGRVFIRIFPHKSVTSRPLETRMGKGKGEPDRWVAIVKPGTILFEVTGVPREGARDCFNRVAHKLPVRVRLVGRRPVVE